MTHYVLMDMVLCGVVCFIGGTWFGLFVAALINMGGKKR